MMERLRCWWRGERTAAVPTVAPEEPDEDPPLPPTRFPPGQWQQLRVMVAFLRSLSNTPGGELLALRGSLALLAWAPDAGRMPGDVDLVLLEGRSRSLAPDIIRRAISGNFEGRLRFRRAEQQDLWDYSDMPGTRFIIPWQDGARGRLPLRGELQIDVAEGECLPLAPRVMSLSFPGVAEPVSMTCCAPELNLAWKLRWLFAESYPEVEDFFDALVLLRSCPQGGADLRTAVTGTFRHYQLELDPLYDFLSGEFLRRFRNYGWRELLEQSKYPPIDIERAIIEVGDVLTHLLDGVGLPRAAELPLLRKVLAAPNDNHARLIYADWLEDQGDERAELLRLDAALRNTLSPGSDPRARRHAELIAAVSPQHSGWVSLLCGVYSVS